MIRRAGPDDAAAVSRLVDAAFRHYVERIGKPPAPMLLDYAIEIRDHDVWVDEWSGGLRAVVVIRQAPDHWLIDVIAVAPSVQGTGVGAGLLSFVEEQAARAGVAELRLFTNEAMTANLSYYPRRGFTEFGRRVEDGYARVYFTKPVNGP